MEVTIVTIISLTPVVIGLSLTNIMKKLWELKNIYGTANNQNIE
jgi:hypothetical protein